MAIDANGNSHKAAGRPDGGQFDHKAGQGSDDDLDFEAADARLSQAMPDMDAVSRRRLIGAVTGGGDPFAENGLEGLPDGAKAMARIMAARGGDGIYRDLAKYNEAMGWADREDRPKTGTGTAGAKATSAPSMFVGVTLTSETFKGLVSGGMRDFHGADLHGLDLSDYDLKGLNLDGVNLTDARLDKADLTGTSLKDAVLDGASMRKVKTEGAVFDGASMRRVDLTGSSFGDKDGEGAGVSFKHADMEGANLSALFYPNADMTGASLRNSTCDDEYGVYFVPDRIKGLDLRNARWNGGHLCLDSGADFSGGHFTNMSCFVSGDVVSNADLRDSFVADTVCEGCDMRGARVSEQVRLTDCDLRNATLVDFLGANDLRGCRFEGARYGDDVKGVRGVRTDVDPEGKEPFDPESLGIRSR